VNASQAAWSVRTLGPRTKSTELAAILATVHAAYRGEDAEGRLLWAMTLTTLVPLDAREALLAAHRQERRCGP